MATNLKNPNDRYMVVLLVVLLGVLTVYLQRITNSPQLQAHTSGLAGLYSDKKKAYDEELERLKVKRLS